MATRNRRLIISLLLLCSTAFGGTKVPVNIQSFNSGELSPLMNARTNYPKYSSGARTLQNMLVRSQGPICRRPGTKYIAAVKDATDATRLISFEYSTSDAYVVEISDYYARFYRNGGQIVGTYSAWVTSTAYVIGDLVTNAGSYYRCLIAHTSGTFATDLAAGDWEAAAGAADLAYEIVTPWDESDVFDLQFAQDAEVMRIVHGDYEPYKLTRTGHTAWTCTAIGSTTGPFQKENQDTTWTLTPSATTGTGIDIVSTDNLFVAGHIGGLFQISHSLPTSSISKLFWASGTTNSSSITVQKYRYYDVITSGAWKGTFIIQRSYDAGVTWENVYAVEYAYNGNIQYSGQELEETCLYRMRMEDQYITEHNVRHDEAMCYGNFNARGFINNGVVEITSVTDANNAVADVKITLGSTDATYRWAEGYWSDYRGWPRTVEHHEQRVIYGGSDSFPQTIWASIIAEEDTDFDDFTANTISDASGNLGGPDDVAWTYPLPGMNPIQWLKSGDYLMVGTTSGVGKLGQPDKPITPNYIPIFRIQNHDGCAYQQPHGAGASVLYIERGAQKVRELTFSYVTDKYVAPDMTVLSEHITGDGIVDSDFQNRPEPILWCVRDDGQLLSFTYRKTHEVMAWGRSNTGASGEFKSVAVIPGTNEDQLWAVVDRTVNSTDVKYVEQMQNFDWGTDQNDCWFSDSAGTDGNDLAWLKGEEVAVFADGRPIGNYTVSGSGTISASGYTNYIIGLPYTSIYESMPIVANAGGVTSALMKTAILNINMDFHETLACNIGVDADNTSALQFSDDEFATTIDVFTGPWPEKLSFPRGSSRDMTIYIDVNEPVPMTVRSINPYIQIYSDQ